VAQILVFTMSLRVCNLILTHTWSMHSVLPLKLGVTIFLVPTDLCMYSTWEPRANSVQSSLWCSVSQRDESMCVCHTTLSHHLSYPCIWDCCLLSYILFYTQCNIISLTIHHCLPWIQFTWTTLFPGEILEWYIRALADSFVIIRITYT
jgi:hypothetical protein